MMGGAMFEGRRMVLACRGGHDEILAWLGVAKALQALGHWPILATCRSQEMLVRSHGVAYVGAAPHRDEVCQVQGLSPGALSRRWGSPWRGASFDSRVQVLPQLARVCEDLRRACEGAHVLVAPPQLPWAPWVAAQMNLPWVQLLTQPRDVWGAPLALPWLPSTLMAALPPRLQQALLAQVAGPQPQISRALDALPRQWVGRADIGHATPAPLARVALLSEVLMGPSAQPGVVPPVELAGLSWFDGAGRRLPSAVEAFLMEGPPPVVFAFRGPDAAVVAKLYGHAAKVCAQLDLRAVLVGGDRVPGVSHLPGQLVLPWVSTAPLLPRSAALVSAGCMSLCGQAAMAGCPQVLVPMGWDQHDVAARFAREGGALKLTHRQATGEGLATALLRVVYGSALRRQASRWPDRINRVCGTVRAAHVIDGLFSLPRMSVQA